MPLYKVNFAVNYYVKAKDAKDAELAALNEVIDRCMNEWGGVESVFHIKSTETNEDVEPDIMFEDDEAGDDE